MACAKPSDCAPCNKCPESPQPVMPRCDIALTDGTYTNATVVVENGCIIDVQAGTPPLYTPDSCCAPVAATTTGTTTDAGLDGAPGPQGPGATVSVGAVMSLPYGSPPTVDNIGSDTDAVFNFGIPRGEPGTDAELPTGGASSTDAGIQLEQGLIMSPLPVAWPPVLDVTFFPTAVLGVSLGATKDPVTGQVQLTVDLTGFVELMSNLFSDQQTNIDGLQTQITAQQTLIDALTANVQALETRVAALEAAP